MLDWFVTDMQLSLVREQFQFEIKKSVKKHNLRGGLLGR